jgi:hypothetical protein
MKKISTGLLIISMITIAVLSSGCTVPISKNTDLMVAEHGIYFNTNSNSVPVNTSETLNKTFSKEGITFNYPSNWFEYPAWIDQSLGGDSHGIGLLAPPVEDGAVVIDTYNLSRSGANSIHELINQCIAGMKRDNFTVDKVNITTINGLTFYEISNHKYESDLNGTQKMLYFGTAKGQYIYVVQFYAKSDSFDRYLPVFNKVVSTIKIE